MEHDCQSWQIANPMSDSATIKFRVSQFSADDEQHGSKKRALRSGVYVGLRNPPTFPLSVADQSPTVAGLFRPPPHRPETRLTPSPSGLPAQPPGLPARKAIRPVPSSAAIHGATPEPDRVVVIRTSHFDPLAALHLDRVPIPSFISPLNARHCVRVCRGENLTHFSSESPSTNWSYVDSELRLRTSRTSW